LSELVKPSVLILPKWYPHEFDLFDGNFVENHLQAIKHIAEIKVAFVHSDKNAKKYYRLEHGWEFGYEVIRIYFKKADSPLPFLNGIITAFRYLCSQGMAYRKLYPHKKKPELVHVHVLLRAGLFAYFLKQFARIPYVITEHWSGYLPERNQFKGGFKKWISKILIRKSESISVPATYLKESMLNHGLYGNYRVIPNVVDTELFAPPAKGSNYKRMLYVGNLQSRHKRILDIINVVAEVAEEDNDFDFHIYGEGREEANCRALIRSRGMEERIKLMGTLPRKGIAEVMAESGFLILFSAFENQPCVLAEAMSCGLPVVAPDIPGIVEFTPSYAGLIFPRLDRDKFKESLITMLNTVHSYNRKKIRQYALATFSEEVISKQFRELYQKALPQ
jgi:glycosyltransferase involved in cell wall biosynthesis